MGKSKLKEPLASRELAGHSRVAAAQLLGVHVRTWQAWEKGRSPMPPQWLQLYRHLAGVERIPFRSSDYPRPEVSSNDPRHKSASPSWPSSSASTTCNASSTSTSGGSVTARRHASTAINREPGLRAGFFSSRTRIASVLSP